MKFSYDILKKFVPDIPPIDVLAEKITMHLFEVEDNANGILDIKILPNRYSDAACYRGLAREIAAICDSAFEEPKLKKPKIEIAMAMPATIHISPICRRIMTACLAGARINESPAWLKEALNASGIRSINAIVDIANYAMLETGQPLHAFDYDTIDGSAITVRQAHEGETVETIDGKTVVLNPSALVLADEKNALDIAGIKGGKKAEITLATKNIVLTAAHFDGTILYKTSKRIGLATDASIRFSHNLSPVLVERGLYRALTLMQEVCGGKIGKIHDAYPQPQKPVVIAYDFKIYKALSGVDMSEARFIYYLKKLGCVVRSKKIIPPPERTDLERCEDIVEEVLRLYGYEHMQATAPVALIAAPYEQKEITLREQIRTLFAEWGFTEHYAPTCTSEGEIQVENPLTAEQSFLRASLMPGLCAAVEKNTRFFDDIALFEIGRVFHKKTNHEPAEEICLGIALSRKKSPADETPRLARGIIEELFMELAVSAWHIVSEGQKDLVIMVGQETVGRLSYRGGAGGLTVAEIRLDAVQAHCSPVKKYVPPPKYPSIIRDISLRMSPTIRMEKVIETIRASTPPHLHSINVIDIYQDSITLHLVFRSPNRTLTDTEVNSAMKNITLILEQKYKAKIR